MSISNDNLTPIRNAFKLTEVKMPEISPAQLKSLQHDWVPFGKRNDFPDFLIAATKKCTEHSSLIATRQDLIAGEGITFSKDKAENDRLSVRFAEINSDGETINDLLNQYKPDGAILESIALQVVWSKDKKTITDVYYQDSSKVRPSKRLNERGQPVGYWYCPNWIDVKRNPPVYFDRFDIKKPGGTQLYWYHQPSLGQPYLRDVSYGSALPEIELAYKMSTYALNYVENGFFASGIFNVPAESQEKLEEADLNITKTFLGESNAGRVVVFSTGEDGKGVTYTPLAASDPTPLIANYQKLISEKVCTAHRANPIIAGIQTGGNGLGSDGKLYTTAVQTFYNLVIRNLQKPFLDFWKLYGKVMGEELDLDIASSALLQTDMPEVLQDMLKPEIRIAEWGYKAEDLIDYVAPDTNPLNAPTAPAPTVNDIPKNPFN